MKICLVQSSSEKGKIDRNIKNHLSLIDSAVKYEVDVIVFPELSVTGYEPKLAHKLAFTSEDSRFRPFQDLSDTNQVTIGIGVPTQWADGIRISLIFFRPFEKCLMYSKHILHDDELPYFVSGEKQNFVIQRDLNLAFGICYETLTRQHLMRAIESKADLFIASVAKPSRASSEAYLHFAAMAEEFAIPILMVNSVGPCDDFISNGKSAAWSKDGKLVAQLDELNQGLLIYDTNLEEGFIVQNPLP